MGVVMMYDMFVYGCRFWRSHPRNRCIPIITCAYATSITLPTRACSISFLLNPGPLPRHTALDTKPGRS